MTGIDSILQSSKVDESTKELVKAAYFLGRTDALNEIKKPFDNDGMAEFNNELFADNI